MFLLNTDQLLLTIILVSMAVLILGLIVFVCLKAVKRNMGEEEKSPINIDEKVKRFANTLNDFYVSIGGASNVNQIQLNKEKNCIVVSVVDPNNATNFETLKQYGLFKSEIIDLDINLYFLNSEDFYNSLLGK